jgi:hypothetical protein
MCGYLPILLSLLTGVADAHEQRNPLYAQLVTAGVCVDGKTLAVLSRPTLPDGATAAEQQTALKSIPLRTPLSEFTRDSVVAPFAMVVGQPADAEAGVRLRTLDVWFVVHADLSVIKKDPQLLESFLRKAEGDAHAMSDEELAAREIQIPPAVADRTHYAHAASTLLDRVRLSVSTRTVYSQSEESTVLAGEIDQRFADDSEFPNEWRPVEITSRGSVVGEPAPYRISASYWKATQLDQPEGAILFEHHAVFEQPLGWFGGRDLLRSKLPMAVQTEVRSFRRKLKKATQNNS